MNYKVSQMFVITYLLLFCFFTALCTNATKNANERACEMPSLAKTPGLQQNTQTLLPRLAIRLGWLGSRIRLAFHHWFGPHLGACRKTVNQEESKLVLWLRGNQRKKLKCVLCADSRSLEDVIIRLSDLAMRYSAPNLMSSGNSERCQVTNSTNLRAPRTYLPNSQNCRARV
ncbi:hypothetical protein L596_007391 [Steinernema carpocapsae]|uniref:Uncharacterized protein n=1 Tax=Steinernema carpocapsae TaxID=34508 RepID=A0A4U5P9T6_STECR|nr:hypothetical protein L596_007391 [Steinernema carpocapsae]